MSKTKKRSQSSVPPLGLEDAPVQKCKVHRFSEVVPNEKGECNMCNSTIDKHGECTGDEYSVWLNQNS